MRSLDLVPGQAVEVELPMFDSGVVPLTITADSGFFPKDVDQTSNDRRFLGIWVEVKSPSAKASDSAKATSDKTGDKP